ncbi:MAG: hypothetical protein GYB64_08835 [Chloroflexi bacterium]|nr:hypothetical protein [Chloroflexota bacterium]
MAGRLQRIVLAVEIIDGFLIYIALQHGMIGVSGVLLTVAAAGFFLVILMQWERKNG